MKRSLISTGVAIFLLAFLAVEAAGQAGATVSGTIRDQNSAVIVNAEVEVLNIATGRTSRTKTDSAGKYQLTGLLPGSYQAFVSSAGFATAARSFTLRKVGSDTEDFVLVPGVIESSMTLTAGKGGARVAAETPQMVTIAEAPEIEEQRPKSTLGAVNRTPNLTPVIANAALERPRLRGLASNRLLIILDGERLNNARSDPTSGISPSVIDVTQLDSVEVLSGAGSSLYGSDAMGGIINLVTPAAKRSDGPHYLGLRLTGDIHSNGQFRRGAATVNWSESKFALRLTGSLFRESNYHAGDQSVSVDDVVRLGQLATEIGHAIENNVARTY